MRDIQPDLKYQDNKRLKSTVGLVCNFMMGDLSWFKIVQGNWNLGVFKRPQNGRL